MAHCMLCLPELDPDKAIQQRQALAVAMNQGSCTEPVDHGPLV